MDNQFDLISIFAAFLAAKTLWDLWQNRSSFWDERITAKDRELVQRLAVFGLVPIGVLLHELGHCLATWQVGGTVSTFQWRFYWGYIIPEGNFTPAEYWWIALSGNLVSILLGLLPIFFIFRVKQRIIGELLYTFACVELIYSLIGYPLLSFGLQRGDWLTIYHPAIQPYAGVTLILHGILLTVLWRFLQSQKLVQWRLARNSRTLEVWRKLQANVDQHPRDFPAHLNLAYFLFQNNEIQEGKKVAKSIYRMHQMDDRVHGLQAVEALMRRAYKKAIKISKQSLKSDELAIADQLRLYRILCFSLNKIRKPSEALSYADQGLEFAPEDYKLHLQKATAHQMLKQYAAAQANFELALAYAPDEDVRQQIQQWRKTF